MRALLAVTRQSVALPAVPFPMGYGARRYAMDRERGDGAAREAERVATVRRDIEERGLGPAVTKVRPSDRRTLVLDAKGWVHAVVWAAFDPRMRVYYAVAADLRGDAWEAGSKPWAPRAPREDAWGDAVA